MDMVHNGQGDASTTDRSDEDQHHESAGINKTVATVAVVAAGAALFEVALLPGLILGVAAVAAPSYFPRLAGALTPIFKSTVRGTYRLAQKSKEALAGVHEQVNNHVNNIVAKVRAEDADTVVNAPAASEPSTAA